MDSGECLIIFGTKLLIMKFRIIARKLFKYFLQGLIILAPITITFWAVLSLFNWVDSILPDFIHRLFPRLALDENGNPRHIPGLGFILVMVIVLGVGYVSSSFIVSKLVELFDNILEKTPGIKIIYSTIKDFFEAFAGNRRKFDRAVLVSIEAPDVWRIGFITHEELTEFGLQEYISVYIPQSYAFAGHLYFVKKERVRLITDITSTEAMKFAISGGVTNIED
ncbi:MAG TPA: DUF502 domain-containing protein [Puia sp.]|nr:DUF502 domain-containing protein [Puia sp.]